MPDLRLQITDERKLTVPTGRLTLEQTREVGEFITSCGRENYPLVNIQTHQTSDMRGEKYVDGYTFTFKKQ